MFVYKNMVLVILIVNAPLLAQDRESTKTTTRERDLERLVHEINNNNNNYREPNRNISQNSNNKDSNKK